MKVPAIFWHPGRIPAGEVTDIMVSQYDFLPTILDYAGTEAELQDKDQMPGRSFVDALSGMAGAGDDLVVVFDEYGPVRMIRDRRYKYIHRYNYGKHEIYDM